MTGHFARCLEPTTASSWFDPPDIALRCKLQKLGDCRHARVYLGSRVIRVLLVQCGARQSSKTMAGHPAVVSHAIRYRRRREIELRCQLVIAPSCSSPGLVGMRVWCSVARLTGSSAERRKLAQFGVGENSFFALAGVLMVAMPVPLL